jgi:hypothetical protein
MAYRFKEKDTGTPVTDPNARKLRVNIGFEKTDQVGAWPDGQPLDPSRIMRGAVPFDPNTTFGQLPAVKRCIYCDQEFYADGSSRPLGGEHIVPQAFGGTLELSEACCSRHEALTSSIEGSVSRRHLLAVRRRLGLRSKKKAQKNEHVPVTFTSLLGGKEVQIEPPLEEHPTVLVLPRLHPPGLVFPRPGFGGIFCHPLVSMDDLAQRDIGPFIAAELDMLRFCQMLAKIAHGFACALAGLDMFLPYLRPLITMRPSELRSMEAQCYRFVGGHYVMFSPSENLHEASLAFTQHGEKTLIVVNIRLFANVAGPIYMIAAGEILGSVSQISDRIESRKADLLKLAM